MKFYKKTIRSFDDLPGHNSLIIHCISCSCNLKCFHCHNYDELILKQHKDYYSEEEIIELIKSDGYLFDAIIFSGGEFLLEDIDDITVFLKGVKIIFNGLVIINTNGSNPEKIDYLIENNLVNGFHVDMKLPYHLLDVEKDKEAYQAVLGIAPTLDFVTKLLKSVDIVIKNDNGYSQVRTVKYPILSEEYFEEIRKHVNLVNVKYNKNTKWYLNNFINY